MPLSRLATHYSLYIRRNKTKIRRQRLQNKFINTHTPHIHTLIYIYSITKQEWYLLYYVASQFHIMLRNIIESTIWESITQFDNIISSINYHPEKLW